MTDAQPNLDARAMELRQAFDRAFADEARTDMAPKDDLLAIRIGGEPYALRLSEIAGLFADKPVTRIPSRASGIIGIGGFRGAIVPVYSLAAVIGRPLPETQRWIVIAAAMPVALAFETFDGHLRVPREAIMPRQGDGRKRNYVQHVARAGDGVRPIVHLPAVLDEIGVPAS